ncbi:Gfo/Idh/MocA family protein [Cohnella sp. GCM10027633]|uniref:Gfo/Idh/MocA family protein n=1 Tax=unclassified Cohnella TaxID=2636738 RepID=UPI00362F15FA
MRTKYALVGAGHRGLYMFAKPLAQQFQDVAEFVGIHDSNPTRARYMSTICGGVPVYDDFDRMLAESRADTVIVTTIDSVHDEYIIRALRAGCDVITEKPMTTDDAKCRAILRAEKETGKKVTVTFNMRFAPYVQRIKELLLEGAIGSVLSVHLEYLLDTSHGADYFRRWHRNREYSGGLLVHKSTHHFDMVNWLLGDVPERLYAYGTTSFYGPTREKRGVRCTSCEHAGDCEFYFDLTKDPTNKEMYAEAEKDDGYYRDQCVFGDGITTYDTMSVNLQYASGAQLSYSLNAHCPYEGWKIAINGTKGRIEAESFENPLNAGERNEHIRVFNRRGEAVVYHVPMATGVHGGGDERLLRMLFRRDAEDKLNQQAGSMEGALSMLIGVAANRSIADNRPVSIRELLQEREREDTLA